LLTNVIFVVAIRENVAVVVVNVKLLDLPCPSMPVPAIPCSSLISPISIYPARFNQPTIQPTSIANSVSKLDKLMFNLFIETHYLTCGQII